MLAPPAFAETVKIVVPFAAGGPVDQLARILASELGPKLGDDVIVDDRGGAGGAIAAEAVARANPDGKTMLLGSLGSGVHRPDPQTAGQLRSGQIVRAGDAGRLGAFADRREPSGSASRRMAELIAKAKQQKLSYGSAGPGTTMNIAIEMLDTAAGVKITHVPYRGAAPAITDLLGGHVDMLNADLPVLLPLVKAGTVKALALFSPERSPLLPDLPTTKELGMPSVMMENWYGIFLPAGTPPQVRDKLEQALFAVVAIPAIKQRLAENGMHGMLGHDAFVAMLAKAIRRVAGQDRKRSASPANNAQARGHTSRCDVSAFARGGVG